MRSSRAFRLCLVVFLLLSGFAGANAQQSNSEQIIVPMKSGFYVAFSTTPSGDPDGARGWSSFAEAYFASNTIRRVFVDSGGSLYFGYSLVVEPLPSSKQFRVSVRPLSSQDEQELRARKPFQSRSIHPNYNADAFERSAAPQVIADGDTFALDVLVNPKTGDRVTDFVTVSTSDTRLKAIAAQDIAPRDFTLDDVEMRMINYQLLINGELAAVGKKSGACAGSVIWFYLTERGRFIFSLAPQRGYDFQKIGVIDRNKIKFTLDNERYELVSDLPVVGSGGPWNLYVLYDPNYVPDSYFLGVSGAQTRSASRELGGVAQVERALRLRKQASPSSLNKPSGQAKETVEREAPGARLIVGAASRVENLLPLNTASFAQPGLESNYAKWLYEDAPYIITPQEARAFKQLTTDEQREHFIAQFWRSRDPDPSTAENEYRTEYYRRLAHANETFSFSDIAGWRTDRGRIYILYGKPDEVELLPTGERWRYNNRKDLVPDATFDFININGTGELRLQPPKPL